MDWTNGFDSWQGQGFFSSPPPPDLLWGPPNLLSYPRSKAAGAWSWPLTFV